MSKRSDELKMLHRAAGTRRLPAILILVFTLMTLVFIWALGLGASYRDRDSILENERQHLSRLGTLISGQIDRIFEVVRHDLELLDIWHQQHPDDDPRVDEHLVRIVNVLRRQNNNLIDYRLVDSEGNLFYIPTSEQAKNLPSDYTPQALANVSDREYVRVQTDPNTRGFYISESVKSRVTGKWGIPVSWPLAPNKAGLSVIFAALEFDRFIPMFEDLRPKPNGAVSLVRADSVILARAPLVESSLGTKVSSSPLELFLREKKTIQVMDIVSPFDNLPKLISHARPNPDSAFYMTISVGIDDLLKTWNETNRTTIFGLASLSILLISLAITLLLLQHRLEQNNKLLHQATDAKSRFLAHMSHELRTPLNGVIGLIGIFPRNGLNKDQQHYLEMLQESSRHLSLIINDILDWSRIESGKQSYRREAFDLHELVKVLAGIFRPQVQAKGLEFHLVIEEQVPQQLYSDPDRVRQIILNLLSNALKFTQSGSVELHLWARDGRLHIDVTDTGIGIEPALVEKLFLPYTQLNDSLTRSQGGTGLGLAISREFAVALGGDLSLRSRPGKGSTFSLILPQVQVPANTEATQAPSLNDQTSDASTAQKSTKQDVMGSSTPPSEKKILIVEDTPISLIVLKKMIEHFGYQVQSAETGLKALELCSNERFDLIFMDVQMPELDGLEATRRIRQLGGSYATVPILAMTAHALEGEEQRSLEAGMNAHLTKPVNRDQLEIAIKTWLG